MRRFAAGHIAFVYGRFAAQAAYTGTRIASNRGEEAYLHGGLSPTHRGLGRLHGRRSRSLDDGWSAGGAMAAFVVLSQIDS